MSSARARGSALPPRSWHRVRNGLALGSSQSPCALGPRQPVGAIIILGSCPHQRPCSQAQATDGAPPALRNLDLSPLVDPYVDALRKERGAVQNNIGVFITRMAQSTRPLAESACRPPPVVARHLHSWERCSDAAAEVLGPSWPGAAADRREWHRNESSSIRSATARWCPKRRRCIRRGRHPRRLAYGRLLSWSSTGFSLRFGAAQWLLSRHLFLGAHAGWSCVPIPARRWYMGVQTNLFMLDRCWSVNAACGARWTYIS